MKKLNAAIAALAIALGAGLGAGCVDDPAAAGETNNLQPNDPSEVPESGQLLHVGPTCDPGSVSCLVSLTWSAETVLEAKLVDADGNPVANAAVGFEVNRTGAEGTILSAADVFTDDDGVAAVSLIAGSDSGSVEVFAEAEGLEPIKWVVGVSSKGAADYRVSFDHAGTANMKDIQVRLLDSTVTCDAFISNPNQQAVYQRSNRVDSLGNLPTVVFPDIDNGSSYTAVAYAFSAQNDQVEVAFGCKDQNEAVTNGQPVEVVVQLVDHLPNIVGEYAVTHSFDLRGALPENVRTVVDLIGLLATDPGAFVVGCPDGGQGCPAGGQAGLIDLLANLDFIPETFRDAIQDFVTNNAIGNGLVRDTINQIAQDWLDNNAPSWVNNTVDISGDIYETLKEFRVEGTIRITDAPIVDIDPVTGEVTGIIQAGTAKQVWSEFLFFWSRGCEGAADPQACSTRSFGAAEFSDDGVVEGDFRATVVGSNQLVIEEHALTLNYGALLIGVVEKVVLPAIFGSQCGQSNSLPCDSIDLALQEIISCADVAGAISNPGETVYNIVENLCENTVAQASSSLRDYASENLVADSGDVFLIGTPADEACTLYQPEVYQDDWPGKPLPYIEKLGQERPDEMRCKWQVRINFADNYTADMDGDFFGARTGDF